MWCGSLPGPEAERPRRPTPRVVCGIRPRAPEVALSHAGARNLPLDGELLPFVVSFGAVNWIVSEKTARSCGALTGVMYTTPSSAKSATLPFRLPNPWSFHFIENVRREAAWIVNRGHQEFQLFEFQLPQLPELSYTPGHVPDVGAGGTTDGGGGGEGGGAGGCGPT